MKRVSSRYFGQPQGNGQDPDEPGDRSQGALNRDIAKIGGQGAKGGGSSPTPQTQRMTTGSGSRSARVHISSSYPKNPQKIRG